MRSARVLASMSSTPFADYTILQTMALHPGLLSTLLEAANGVISCTQNSHSHSSAGTCQRRAHPSNLNLKPRTIPSKTHLLRRGHDQPHGMKLCAFCTISHSRQNNAYWTCCGVVVVWKGFSCLCWRGRKLVCIIPFIHS